MDWNAVTLEVGLLALAFLVLAWDLTLGHGAKASRKVHYAIGVAGLTLLLIGSFRLPVDVCFTDALVLDPFALLVKQVVLVAGLLSVPADRVGVKATTNEGLDAIGRGEAIACWASVLLVPQPS